jgi:CheY-like chemotaxis protein
MHHRSIPSNSATSAHASQEIVLNKPVRSAHLLRALTDVLARPLVIQDGKTPTLTTADANTAEHFSSQSESVIPNPAQMEAMFAPADIPDGVRLLLVEDNLVNQKFALMLLNKFGYQVDIAENGLEALSLLAQHPYTLVLMDCQMPVMDGYEASRAIRAGKAGVLNPDIPIIAMTANAMLGDKEMALNTGMDDYLSKPIQPLRLAQTIRFWLKEGVHRIGDKHHHD